MEPLALGQAVAGGALVFFLPGFAVAKAVFPERRLSQADGVRWGLELVALAVVLSVVLTVTVGYVLLTAAPGGFAASWSDPLLESVLAAVALVAFVAGWLEGAYTRSAPGPRAAPAEPGTAGVWELTMQLDRLQQERLALERELRRTAASDASSGDRLRERLGEVTEEEARLRRAREGEYDR